ncbi:MAG: rane protein of unknown function [Candidatus Saccharibacteria bacterium]|nr:rane protein of unknown function [Candidatus Saccharibacteria bacterium]
MKQLVKPGRIEALDFLRGYFIIVIIIDHLYRWPSFLTLFTGQGLLWSNASDGFIIIAGLLVGYIRGFKAKDAPFRKVAVKLGKRSLSLYVWSVVISLVLVAIQWAFTFQVSMPNVFASHGDWGTLIHQAITLYYAHPWVYFLHLYAIFMLLAIATVWLLRRNLWWVVVILALIGLAIGHATATEWLERQALFFIPAVVGYYLDPIQRWVLALSKSVQNKLSLGVIGIFVVTVALSILWQFWPGFYSQGLHDFLSTFFGRSPMNFGAVGIAFVWFVGLFALFQRFLPFLKKRLGWLILPFGSYSLSAYILHGVPILIASYFFALSDNIWLNTLLGILSVLMVWVLIRMRFVQRLLPQ